jgi:hypothetical protein
VNIILLLVVEGLGTRTREHAQAMRKMKRIMEMPNMLVCVNIDGVSSFGKLLMDIGHAMVDMHTAWYWDRQRRSIRFWPTGNGGELVLAIRFKCRPRRRLVYAQKLMSMPKGRDDSASTTIINCFYYTWNLADLSHPIKVSNSVPTLHCRNSSARKGTTQ